MSPLWQDGKPITVSATEHGKPLQLTMDGEVHTVELICNRWRDGGAWWSGESEREYIKLATETGLLCLIAKDVVSEPTPQLQDCQFDIEDIASLHAPLGVNFSHLDVRASGLRC